MRNVGLHQKKKDKDSHESGLLTRPKTGKGSVGGVLRLRRIVAQFLNGGCLRPFLPFLNFKLDFVTLS